MKYKGLKLLESQRFTKHEPVSNTCTKEKNTMEKCYFCETQDNLTKHHLIHVEKNPHLKKCELNKIVLCEDCHRLVHSKRGKKLDEELQLLFQNRIELLFCKREFNFKEIKDTLQITDSKMNKLFKDVKNHKGYYKRDDILKAILKECYKHE